MYIIIYIYIYIYSTFHHSCNANQKLSVIVDVWLPPHCRFEIDIGDRQSTTVFHCIFLLYFYTISQHCTIHFVIILQLLCNHYSPHALEPVAHIIIIYTSTRRCPVPLHVIIYIIPTRLWNENATLPATSYTAML